jgi:signal transduction histidine kinase
MSPNNDLAQAELKVREFMLAMKERAAGQYYSFTYETSLKNDGSNQPVTVTMPGSVTDTFIQIPSKNMLQWIIANWWIVLILLAAIGFLVFYLQKNKKETKQKQFELEEKAKAEYARIKSEQERADAEMAQQLAEQERQMNQMRMKAQQEEEAKRQLQKNEHAEDRKKELLQEMRMRGNLPWLIVQIKGQEYRHEIDNPLFTIGREESNSLCIPVSTISRRHALIKFNQGEYLIEDLQSSNGVVVNGEKYQEILLAHGDVVQLGDVYLTFMI